MASRLHDIFPRRVALVKRGANQRRILLTKADEEQLDTVVADILADPVAKEDALLDAVRQINGDESVEKAASTLARAAAALGSADFTGDDTVVKAARKRLRDAMNTVMDEHMGPGEPDDEEPDEDEAVAKAYDEICKKDYDAETRRKMAANGEAMPGGRYPIADREDLQDAIHAIGRGKGSHAAIKAHIVRRAKALGAASMLPDDWNVSKEDDTMTETALPVKKEDGTYDLTAVPEESRATVEAILKARDDELAELRKEKEAEQSKADEAIEIAKAEREHRERAEYIAKAASLENLAKSDEEIGDLLLAVAKAERDEHLPKGTAGKLDELLKAANEAAAAVFKEAGRTGHTAEHQGGEAKLNAAADEVLKEEPKLTRPQAIAKALERDPSLYAASKEA